MTRIQRLEDFKAHFSHKAGLYNPIEREASFHY